MTIEVRVPQLPESVADATLVSWHKKPGDSVARDENLVDLETDKVVLEVPAPTAGVLKEIKLNDGATVTSGQILALIEEGVGAAAAPKTAAKEPAKESSKESSKPDAAGKLSPAAKRVAEENKIDRRRRRLGPRRTGFKVGRGELSGQRSVPGCRRCAAPKARHSSSRAGRGGRAERACR